MAQVAAHNAMMRLIKTYAVAILRAVQQTTLKNFDELNANGASNYAVHSIEDEWVVFYGF